MSTDVTAVPALQGNPVGLHSPPDSNPAMRDGSSDSELSDLEPETDKSSLLDIKPSYISEGGVPVFKPSMDEFEDFERYMKAVDKYGMQSGIIKIIPPPEWKAAQPRLDEVVKTIRVKEPIMQEIMGQNGEYRQTNLVHQRSYNLPQWRALCDESNHQPPARRGERRANQAPAKNVPKQKSVPKKSSSGSKRKSGRTSKGKAASNNADGDIEGTPDRLPTPVSPSTKNEDDNDSMDLEQEPPVFRRMGGRQPKAVSTSARRMNNKRETGQVDEEAFKDFKYDLDSEVYTKERTDWLEEYYWKTLTYNSPLYGADMPGSLFDERTKSWNLGNLPNLLDVLAEKIPGVNTAYLYLGMWKATFAWHLEDVDLYSINYLHFGAPKQWYSISQKDARKFEAAMASIWPSDSRACNQFLRHKTFLISPSTLLKQHGIKVNKVVHHPGEFVVTYPYGYHSGYNLGYNCAEAVNFALDSWLPLGEVAKKCDCALQQESVWIEVRDIKHKLYPDDPQYWSEVEVDDDDDDEDEEDEEEEDESAISLPSPPDSNGDIKPKISQKKRKRVAHDKGGKVEHKKIKIRLKPKGKPLREPCLLCPNDIPSEPLLETETGQQVHKICAQYIPETRIEAGTKPIVMDMEHIPPARYALKCNYCRSKKGACFQCSQKKCARAYHATCAAAAGVFVEEGEVPFFGEDNTEYKRLDFGFSCRFHRTKRDKKLDADALGDDERILKAASELKKGEICQMQFHRGDIFAGAVVENRRSEEMLLIDVVPRGERVEVEYKWLLLPDASDYRLPKASTAAVPMPKSFKDRQLLNTTNRQVDDLPRAEDPFVKGCTWAEFNHENILPNPNQVKVDLSKDNQLWYYLGKTSTEARAQYTEDPAKPRHNPKGQFSDTLPKAILPPPRPSYAASYPGLGLVRVLDGSDRLIPGFRTPESVTAVTAPSTKKAEKPYTYKPRDGAGEAYRVDPQSLRSQQSFLQRSAQNAVPGAAPSAVPNAAPYKFGTDPQYKQPSPRVNPPMPNPAGNVDKLLYPRKTFNQGSMGLGAHASTFYQGPPETMSLLAPPAMYRPPRPTAVPVSKAGFAAATKGRSPFAKYTYLQKEHNRSPLEYKSPYRPGGGFMNGYQGSYEAHMRAEIFGRSTAGSSSPAPGILPPRSASQSTIGMSPTHVQTHAETPKTATTTAYLVDPAPPPLWQQRADGSWYQEPNKWNKRDSNNFHPAIRPEYTLFHHNHSQPAPRQSPSQQFPSPQQQAPSQQQPPVAQSQYQVSATRAPHPAPVLQAAYSTPVAEAPTYSQQVIQSQPAYGMYNAPSPSPSRAPQVYSGESSSPTYNTFSHPIAMQSNAPRPSSQHGFQFSPPMSQSYSSPVPQQSHQGSQASPQPGSSHTPQFYNPVTPRGAVQSGDADQNSYGHNAGTSMGQVPVVQPQYASQPPVMHENKALYPHQQYFQNNQANPVQSFHPHAQLRDFPDVPADSTSIIEKVMMNLRKAPNMPPGN